MQLRGLDQELGDDTGATMLTSYLSRCHGLLVAIPALIAMAVFTNFDIVGEKDSWEYTG